VVAGERPPGAVGAVFAGREADDQEFRRRGAERPDGLVEVVGKLARRGDEETRQPRTQRAVGAETRPRVRRRAQALMRLMMASPKPEQVISVAPGIRRCRSSSTFFRAAMSRLVVARIASRRRARSYVISFAAIVSATPCMISSAASFQPR